METNLKDPKNIPTYRIHGYDRKLLKHKMRLLLYFNATGYEEEVVEIKKLLSEPYGMVRFKMNKHSL